MKEITENLLALARADASGDAMAREPVDLGETLEASLDEILPLAEEKGLAVERDIEEGVRVRGDRKYLAQLAANLLSNAVKFTPAGGRVTVRASARNGEAALEVEDTGPGIPAPHLPHVFERFYRVRQGRDATEGAGLGLAIVDWIVKAHGGRITAANLPGGGAAFRVRLPRDGDSGLEEGAASPEVGVRSGDALDEEVVR
jgi:signal transduction histidine kinase